MIAYDPQAVRGGDWLVMKPDYDKRAVAAEHAVLEEIRTYDRTLAEIRKARTP